MCDSGAYLGLESIKAGFPLVGTEVKLLVRGKKYRDYFFYFSFQKNIVEINPTSFTKTRIKVAIQAVSLQLSKVYNKRFSYYL